MSALIPAIGQSFKVTFDNDKRHFEGKLISIDKDPGNSDRQYKIAISKKYMYDVTGRPYALPDNITEVERNWFNYELTGRKIVLL